MLAHRDEVEHLVFTADGKSIVSASLDGCVKVWHVATGEFVCDLWTSKPNPPVRFALDDESRELYIRLQNGQIIRFLTGSQNKIPVMPHSASRDDTPPSPSRIDKGDKLAPEQPG